MTSPLFLYGPLRLEEVRGIVIGRAVPGRAAVLPGSALHCAQGAALPHLQPQEGAEAPGVLCSGLSEDEQARVDYYATALGLDVQERRVNADGTSQTAQLLAARAPTSEAVAWDYEHWARGHADLERIIAAEVMAEYGRRTAADLARVMMTIRARAQGRLYAMQPKAITRSAPPDLARIEVAQSAPAHFGFFRFDTVTLSVPRFDGTMSDPMSREIFVGHDAALVLPYEPATDRVLLIEQFRLGPWRRGDSRPWTLEPIAGLVEQGESPEDCVRREATEEAGLSVGQVERIATVYASPGYSTEYFHCFLARCTLPEADGRIGGAEDEHEDIRTHILPLDDALAMIESGEIDVGPLAMMLLWLARHRSRIREEAAGRVPA